MARHSGRVLIRVDAGMGIGLGHLARCLALVSQLTSRGVEVGIATRANSEELLERIVAAGATVVALPAGDDTEPADGPVWSDARQRADAAAVLELTEVGWDAVLVDHYRLDAVWETSLAGHAKCIVVIDDLANRPHRADVLIDHNWYGEGTWSRYSKLVESDTLQLLGPRYAMLHADYASARRTRVPVAHPPRRVVVSFGGTDVSGQTIRALAALLRFPHLTVDVVLGSRRAVSEELISVVDAHPQVTLHVELPSLADLLAHADLVIGAGGTATWERLAMGVPALVTTVSDNQSGVTRAFDAAGISRWLGTGAQVTVEDYSRAVSEFISQDDLAVPAIVDGFGAQRVGFAVMPSTESLLERRAVTDLDEASVVGVAGLSSSHGGPSQWRIESETFARRGSDLSQIQVLELEGVPVGVEKIVRGVRTVAIDPMCCSNQVRD